MIKLSEIIPGKLYLGHARSIRVLRQAGMSSILNFARRDYDGKRRHFPIVESYRESSSKLLTAARMIHRRIKRGSIPLYVHCHAGRSRSPVIVALYLWKFRKQFRSFDRALLFVKERHSKTRPKRGLVQRAREIK